MPEVKQFINLPLRLRRQMRQHIRSVLPEEACGFLAGVDMDATAVLPVTNQLHSAVRFVMEPREQLQAMDWIEENGLDILAIYHSHPTGPETPSPTDLAEHFYPDAYCLIWSPTGAGWRLRCFKMLLAGFEELSVVTGVKKVVTGE